MSINNIIEQIKVNDIIYDIKDNEKLINYDDLNHKLAKKNNTSAKDFFSSTGLKHYQNVSSYNINSNIIWYKGHLTPVTQSVSIEYATNKKTTEYLKIIGKGYTPVDKNSITEEQWNNSKQNFYILNDSGNYIQVNELHSNYNTLYNPYEQYYTKDSSDSYWTYLSPNTVYITSQPIFIQKGMRVILKCNGASRTTVAFSYDDPFKINYSFLSTQRFYYNIIDGVIPSNAKQQSITESISTFENFQSVMVNKNNEHISYLNSWFNDGAPLPKFFGTTSLNSEANDFSFISLGGYYSFCLRKDQPWEIYIFPDNVYEGITQTYHQYPGAIWLDKQMNLTVPAYQDTFIYKDSLFSGLYPTHLYNFYCTGKLENYSEKCIRILPSPPTSLSGSIVIKDANDRIVDSLTLNIIYKSLRLPPKTQKKQNIKAFFTGDSLIGYNYNLIGTEFKRILSNRNGQINNYINFNDIYIQKLNNNNELSINPYRYKEKDGDYLKIELLPKIGYMPLYIYLKTYDIYNTKDGREEIQPLWDSDNKFHVVINSDYKIKEFYDNILIIQYFDTTIKYISDCIPENNGQQAFNYIKWVKANEDNPPIIANRFTNYYQFDINGTPNKYKSYSYNYNEGESPTTAWNDLYYKSNDQYIPIAAEEIYTYGYPCITTRQFDLIDNSYETLENKWKIASDLNFNSNGLIYQGLVENIDVTNSNEKILYLKNYDESEDTLVFDSSKNLLSNYKVKNKIHNSIQTIPQQLTNIELIGGEGGYLTVPVIEDLFIQWPNNMYYSYDDENDPQYSLLLNKPSDWDYNYTNYYLKNEDLYIPVTYNNIINTNGLTNPIRYYRDQPKDLLYKPDSSEKLEILYAWSLSTDLKSYTYYTTTNLCNLNDLSQITIYKLNYLKLLDILNYYASENYGGNDDALHNALTLDNDFESITISSQDIHMDNQYQYFYSSSIFLNTVEPLVGRNYGGSSYTKAKMDINPFVNPLYIGYDSTSKKIAIQQYLKDYFTDLKNLPNIVYCTIGPNDFLPGWYQTSVSTIKDRILQMLIYFAELQYYGFVNNKVTDIAEYNYTGLHYKNITELKTAISSNNPFDSNDVVFIDEIYKNIYNIHLEGNTLLYSETLKRNPSFKVKLFTHQTYPLTEMPEYHYDPHTQRLRYQELSDSLFVALKNAKNTKMLDYSNYNPESKEYKAAIAQNAANQKYIDCVSVIDIVHCSPFFDWTLGYDKRFVLNNKRYNGYSDVIIEKRLEAKGSDKVPYMEACHLNEIGAYNYADILAQDFILDDAFNEHI